MTKLLATFAFLALATPAFANSFVSLSALEPSQALAGKPLMDQHNQRLGTIQYITKVNGHEAAVITVPTFYYGDNTIALPMTALQAAKNGNGVTVSMSGSELAHLPMFSPGSIYSLPNG